MCSGISNSICLQALLTNDLFLSSIVCITLGWEVRWWRWSFSFWGRAQRGWWVRRSAAQSERRVCRSMLGAGNGWRWGHWCWRCWGSGSGSDRPGREGARWGCEGTDRQLAWQMGHLPASGASVWRVWASGTGRETESERAMEKRRGVIHINVFVCLCACKSGGKIQTSQNKQTQRKKQRKKEAK